VTQSEQKAELGKIKLTLQNSTTICCMFVDELCTDFSSSCCKQEA
jgi:hypothetical protein